MRLFQNSESFEKVTLDVYAVFLLFFIIYIYFYIAKILQEPLSNVIDF